MKAIDLLHYLDRADPHYIEEASDSALLLYRKRQKRTRTALAASLALVVLMGVFLTKPALYAWETRNTVTSWPTATIPWASSKPSSPVFVSAEMPAQKRFAADTPFTLSVGLGQISDYEYATLSISAQGFEITDKDGNTATDRYVRTLSDFDSGDYGVTYGSRHSVTGCEYLEDFTFRYVGSENATGSGVIKLSLQSLDESSTMGDSVTVYYTLQNGVLKLSDKTPVKGDRNGIRLDPVDPESGTVTLSKEDISIRVTLDPAVLYHGQFFADGFDLRAFHIPTQKDYPNDNFTAELVYAETLRTEDYSFFIKKPDEQTESGSYISLVPRVPTGAPIGAYDLRVTDPDTGFVWVFENMALVLPRDIPAYEDLVCEATATQPSLTQGEQWTDKIVVRITLNGESYTLPSCGAFLQYDEKDVELDYIIPIFEPIYSSYIPQSYIPTDAPTGSYTLVVTDADYGYTWSFENFLEITENPDAARFGFYHNMGTKLTVSRSSGTVYSFVASVENRGEPLYTGDPFVPTAALNMQTNNSGWIPIIRLKTASTLPDTADGLTIQTGQSGSVQYELIITPETSCGVYNLMLSYGGQMQFFGGVVEVVP